MRNGILAACAAVLMSFGTIFSFASPAAADPRVSARTPVEMQAAGPFKAMRPANGLQNCMVVGLTDGRSFHTAIRIGGPRFTVGNGPGCPRDKFIGGRIVDSRTVRLNNGMTCRASGPTAAGIWCSN